MMLLVGGVIPDLHKVKTVSPKLSVISYTLVDLNCLLYIQNVLVLLFGFCIFTYLNFYYTHIITCQSVQQYIRV